MTKPDPSFKRRRSKGVSQLRSVVLNHLKTIGVNGDSQHTEAKDDIRTAHHAHRVQRSALEQDLIRRRATTLLPQFAEGCDINPAAIEPYLVQVRSGTPEGDLFRAATLFWSIPVSRGFGRRLRFLVKDRQNDKLIGIIALGDPVFNLSCRDKLIGWDVRTREERLVNVMDAYVLGAIPPYSFLIGGKLVAALAASQEVHDSFDKKYSRSVGIISKETKHAHLALITTSSALGRSSLYNRLKLPGLVEFKRIGETKGYGHFQVPDPLFEQLRQLLTDEGHKYASGHQYGDGPNWRVRVIRAALDRLGLSHDLLYHGIRREVYAVPLALNWKEYLCGTAKRPKFQLPSVQELGAACVTRWMLPRSTRDERYRAWTRQNSLVTMCQHFDKPLQFSLPAP